MKKIMLVCAAGMSTSLLVTKMEKAAAAMGDEVEKAMEAAGVSKPCDVIDMKDYGMMNGEAVYKKAKAMMGE